MEKWGTKYPGSGKLSKSEGEGWWHISVEHDEKPSHTNSHMNWLVGPEI